VFPVDKDVDVGPHLAELGRDAIAERGALGPQPRQGRRQRTRRRVEPNLVAVARELAQRAGKHEEDRHHTTTALTAITGGSPSASVDQVSPWSGEPNSLPL